MEPWARWIVASLHVIALGVGLGAVWARGRALRGNLDLDGLRRVFLADNLWGGGALIWIMTGLYRAFGGIEKGTAYYLASNAFHLKMTLFGAIGLLEIWPMVVLIGWRMLLRRGGRPDTQRAAWFARISGLQVVLLVLTVFAATAMARGS